MTRIPRRWIVLVTAAAVPALAAVAFLAGCSRHSPLVRKNPLVRSLFYPPAASGGTGLGEDTPGGRFDHSLYGELLAAAVGEDGRVDYGVLAERGEELDRYLGELAAVDLDSLSRHSRLALLVNAYNAFTWKLILEHPGVESIRDIPAGKRWKARRWRLGGETVSLDELEHERIRPVYGEPRVHFALVCAAESCPPLRREPYDGERLDEQLDDQAREFFARPENFRWEPEARRVSFSEILDWFRGDFVPDGAGEKALIDYTLPYLPAATAKEIEAAGEIAIAYIPYDWSLNGEW